MSVVPPNRKAFLDIRLVQGCMDAQAKRLSIAFAEWIKDTNWGEKETWGRYDPPSYPTTEQLYDLFIESITK